MHDTKAQDHLLNPGDRVYIRRRVQGRNKIQDAWGSRVFKVQSKMPEHDVYTVTTMDDTGEPRKLNRRDLRLRYEPPWEPSVNIVPDTNPSIATPVAPGRPDSDNDQDNGTDSDSSSDGKLRFRIKEPRDYPSDTEQSELDENDAHVFVPRPLALGRE